MSETKLVGPDELRLTPRESGAIACMLDGLTTWRAAEALGLSRDAFNDVMWHVRKKFGVKRNHDLMAQARRLAAASKAMPA